MCITKLYIILYKLHYILYIILILCYFFELLNIIFIIKKKQTQFLIKLIE